MSFFKVSVSLMCPESVPTVSFVSRCPSNAKEWKSASFRKRCDDVGKIQKCTKAENFVYHCVLNDEATALLEVCAPLISYQVSITNNFLYFFHERIFPYFKRI